MKAMRGDVREGKGMEVGENGKLWIFRLKMGLERKWEGSEEEENGKGGLWKEERGYNEMESGEER